MFTQICALRGGEYSASYGRVRVKEKGGGKETVAFPSFELRGTDKLYFAPPFLPPPNACCYCLASPLTHPTPFFSPFSRLELLICPLLSLSPRNAIHTYYSAEKREGKIFFSPGRKAATTAKKDFFFAACLSLFHRKRQSTKGKAPFRMR